MKTETAQSTSAQNEEETDDIEFFEIAKSFNENSEKKEQEPQAPIQPAEVGSGIKRTGSRHDLQKQEDQHNERFRPQYGL